MFILYGIVAVCGYYYFGSSAHELVTEDLAIDSPVKDVSLLIPGFTIDKLVSACILVNVFTTYPNLLLVIQVIILPLSHPMIASCQTSWFWHSLSSHSSITPGRLRPQLA